MCSSYDGLFSVEQNKNALKCIVCDAQTQLSIVS